MFDSLNVSVSAGILRYTHYTLHTTHYTLHTTHCTLHTTHYTPHNTHCTLRTTHYTLHTDCAQYLIDREGKRTKAICSTL